MEHGQVRWTQKLLFVSGFVPAIIASAAICALLGWGLGAVSGLVVAVLVWCTVGCAGYTRFGEKAALTEVLHWKPVDLDEAVGFPARAAVAEVTGLDLGAFEFYRAIPAEGPNALAIGGRSVGLSNDFISLCEQRELGRDEIVAVLTHEMGHHSAGLYRNSVVLMLLHAPAFYLAFFTRQIVKSMWKDSPWVIAGLGLAVALGILGLVEALPPWETLLIVVLLLVVFVLVPIITGRVRQTEEFRADRYAADCGYGVILAKYLSYFRQGPENWWERATSSHPRVADRIQRLQAAEESRRAA